MSQKCWSLEKVVEEAFVRELEAIEDEETRNVRKKELYENSRKFLCEIFELIGFDIEFLKEEGGYANKGVYRIPALDCGFFEDLINERNKKVYKIMKTGRFHNCDQEKLMWLIDNLCEVLKHLDIDYELI